MQSSFQAMSPSRARFLRDNRWRLIGFQVGAVALVLGVAFAVSGYPYAFVISGYVLGAGSLMGLMSVAVWQVSRMAPARSSERTGVLIGGILGIGVVLMIAYLQGVIAGGHPSALLVVALAGLYTIPVTLSVGFGVGWVIARLS
jgi:hypothetical protein